MHQEHAYTFVDQKFVLKWWLCKQTTFWQLTSRSSSSYHHVLLVLAEYTLGIFALTSLCQSCILEASLRRVTLLCMSKLSTHVLHCCGWCHICCTCRQVAFYTGSTKPFLALLLTLCKRLMAATGVLTVVGCTQQRHATLHLNIWTTCWNVP